MKKKRRMAGKEKRESFLHDWAGVSLEKGDHTHTQRVSISFRAKSDRIGTPPTHQTHPPMSCITQSADQEVANINRQQNVFTEIVDSMSFILFVTCVRMLLGQLMH